MPRPGKTLDEMNLAERDAAVQITTCRPLHTAKAAIDFAIGRFNETWLSYRSITPTLYAIAPTGRGAYVTLGRLRARHGLDWRTVDALAELLELRYGATGYLVAGPGVGGTPLRPLFAIQGHDEGERHYGALDLATLAPFEGPFTSELDVAAERWRELWQEAFSNAGLGTRVR